MAWLFASGHAVDLVLAVIAAEFAWMTTRFGWPVRAAALRLLPGVLMLLGVCAALVDAAWPWVALPLLASLPVHLLDLAGTRPGDLRRPARPVRSS